MRMLNWVGCIFAGGLAGCSLYPIPDDVSIYSTEKIVRYGRCEVRNAVLLHMLDKGIITRTSNEEDIKRLIKEAKRLEKAKAEEKDKEKAKLPLDRWVIKLLRLAKVAVVYSFDFNITENNKTGASAGFRLPWLTSNVLDAEAAGALDLTRQGSRVFGTEDNWEDLITDTELCNKHPWPRSEHFVYPLTGSIGVGRVVETFIDIDDQGGAKDNFVDTMTFTTQASVGADATVKLEPVSNQFRVVSGTAGVSASRLDIHKLTISLAFPQQDPPSAITGVVRIDGDLNAPFERPAPWRARYNLCVQDARSRENTFKQLRFTAPEVYCISYADEFAPKYADRRVVVTTSQSVPARRGTATVAPAKAAPARAAPAGAAQETRPVRQNLRPLISQ
ncbi:hypothetical protein [Bradyrhizobium sp. JYMT SZCCT0180]|uniref:hypothetical protein n=1 Tax=Bradyrhizobium sp. JYMT SZCCT0180 TaxID=2807666 RepID=UPI001BA547A1|nr:hypothetical protein [Bradyrhizobium sp. JYMT SZCCT0180]MBR1213665.1 hypothetical protein [Bradyrhizobium sp. JYMT SZCCT0180]